MAQEISSGRRLPLVLVLAVLPVLIALFVGAISLPLVRAVLPLGYSCLVQDGNRKVQGRVPQVEPEWLQPLLSSFARGEVRLAARVWSPRSQRAQVHLSVPSACSLWINGVAVPIAAAAELNPVRLQRGWNEVLIRQRFTAAGWRGSCRFFFFGQDRPGVFPALQAVPPNQPLGTVLVHFIRLLQLLGRVSGYLALLLVFVSVVWLGWRRSQEPHRSRAQAGSRYLLSRLGVRAAALVAVGFELTGRLRGAWLLLLAAFWLAALAVELKRGRVSAERKWRVDPRALLVFVLSAVLASLYVWMVSGAIFPLEPVGGIDLLHHLGKTKHIERLGIPDTPANWEAAYPQGSHALLVLAGRAFAASAEAILTPTCILLFAGIVLLLYAVGRQHGGPANPAWLLLALLLVNLPRLLESLFVATSFPTFFSFFFFFAALLFFRAGHHWDASLALAAAVAVYPFFSVIFLAACFLPLVARGERSFRQLWRASLRALPLLLPAIVVTIHFSWKYVSAGMVRAHLLALGRILVIPLDALEPVGAFLLLSGLAWLVDGRRLQPALASAGLIVGFLVYYIPYLLVDAFGFYYIIKLIFLLFFWAALVGGGVLRKIWHAPGWKNRLCILSLALLSLWAHSASLANTRRELRERRISINLPGRPYQGLLPACEWIAAAYPRGQRVFLASDNGYLRELLQMILGDAYPIQDAAGLPAGRNGAAPMLVERDFALAAEVAAGWHEAFRSRDFVIFLPPAPGLAGGEPNLHDKGES